MDPVDLALVLAIDVSASVDYDEFALMLGGLSAAFLDHDVIAAATGADMNQAAERVYQIVTRVVQVAEQYDKMPHLVARRMAERRIDLIGSLGHT